MFVRTHEVRDLTRAVRVYQDHLDGIQSPAPRTIHQQRHVYPLAIHPTPEPPQITMGM